MDSPKKKFRIFIIVLSIIGLSAALFTNINENVAKIITNKKSLVELESYYEELINSEASLKSEVTKLSDDDYLVRYAKEKYLYSTDGEIIIRFE